MKRFPVLIVSAFLACLSFGQAFPFELEADRKPKTITKGRCLIRGARVMTAAKDILENTDVLVENGKIVAIGRNLSAKPGTVVIDARGKTLAPGIVDGHSHRASDGTNEGAESITCEVRIRDVLNPSATNVWQALASGHTSALILHGSANAVGGESVVIKYKFQKPASEVIIEDAPRQVKFALGENVTQKSSTNSTRFPRTRMGVETVYRRAFQEAKDYMAEWDAFNNKKTTKRPRTDIRLGTLADILRRKVWVQCHSYRSDEMLMMVRLSQEYGFKIGAMQHALEAYKIAPELAKADVGVSMFVDNWSFKAEGYDAIPWNAAICTKNGVNVSINTDGLSGTTALNIDAAKTMRFGGLSELEALKTVTINTAKQLGIDKRTGSIEVGKDADLVLWSSSPMSVYAKCLMTMIEGEVYFERRDAFGVDTASPTNVKLAKPWTKGEAKALPASRTYAIVDAAIYPVSSPMIPSGTVVVQDGKIVAAGANVGVPSGAVVVRGRGLRVYPGFFDGYSTLGLGEISPIATMMDGSELGSLQPDLDAATALWVESAHYGPARYNGITNAFTGPTSGSVSGQGAVINMDGYTTEQFTLLRKAGLMVNFPGGRGAVDFDVCDEVADASVLLGLGGADPHDHKSHGNGPSGDQDLTLEQRERYYDLLGGAQDFIIDGGAGGGADTAGLSEYFDEARTYFRNRRSDPTTLYDVQYEALRPYLEGKRLIVLGVRNAAGIRQAVAWSRKERVKVALRGASEAWKEAKLLKEAGIPVILTPAGRSTLGANSPDNPWDPYDTPYASAGILAKAGVKFCFGSGSPAEVMNLAVRVGQHCAYGLSQEDAIRALTLSAAEIFGVQKEIGSIEAGKRGNFIVTDGDPFELTTQIRYVFIDGKPRVMVSKHTMLRDKYQGRKD